MAVTLEQPFARFRRDGDPDALGEVYDQVAARLLRTAIHLTASAARAEDLGAPCPVRVPGTATRNWKWRCSAVDARQQQ